MGRRRQCQCFFSSFAALLPKGETARWRFPVKNLKLDDCRLGKVADQKKQLEDWPKFRNIAGAD
jgi:hypothetical protein